MLSGLELRRARFEDADAALDMDRLTTARARLRADIIDAREAADHEREAELVARVRAIDGEYQVASDRRHKARRALIDHSKSERRA